VKDNTVMTSTAPVRAPRALYQAVWRWHFIAGLMVMPLLVMMAITGGLYLFKDELSHAIYRSYYDVPARAQPMAHASVVIAKTQTALRGRVLQYTPPDRPDRSVQLIVRAPSGQALSAYADPYDGHFLGATSYGGVMQTIRKIHSLQYFGFWASCLIEIAAGWAIIMVGTGFYLWFPRGQKGGVVTLRGDPGSRMFWRDLHAVTGSFVGLIILFLALTGMPWSLFWGVKVQTWVGQHQLYAPKAPAYTQREEMLAIPTAPTAPLNSAEVASEFPWSMEKAQGPQSTMPGMPGMEAMPDMPGMATAPTPIGIDKALAEFRALGLKGSFGLVLPVGPKSAYVANYRPMKVRQTRTIYLDQYSGKVLGDVRFKDWYPGGKAIEWGTSVHQGREYAPVNRYIMLAGCVGILLLAVSSLTMWWKRRPKGKLGLPAAPADPRVAKVVLAIMLVVGVVFPLVGLSLVLALLADWIYGRLKAPPKPALGV